DGPVSLGREERARLADGIAVLELQGVVEWNHPDLAHNRSVLGDLDPASVHEGAVVRQQSLHRGRYRAGKVEVVGVEPTEDRAVRHAKALVDGGRLSRVGLRHPAEMSVRAEDLDRLVSRPAVDDDVLDSRVVLLEDARNGL